MTWHACDGRRLEDLEVAEKLKRLSAEIAARNGEEKAHPKQGYVWRDVVIPSPRLKPYIDKLANDIAMVQQLEEAERSDDPGPV